MRAFSTQTASKLFSPYQFRHSLPHGNGNGNGSEMKTILSVANRIVVAPMCQYSSENGKANDWHLMHWGNLLNSGSGMFIIEATGVSPEARISNKCLGLYDDDTHQALANNLHRARKLAPSTPVLIQLAHAGRKSSTSVPWAGGGILPLENGGWKTYSSSAISFYDKITSPNCIPIEMTASDMKKVRTDFVNAAKRTKEIGIDGIEIHSAHGYLLHQYLSPLSNKRTDAYGGTLQNRLRFPLEIFESVREVFDGVVGLRLSATDWIDEGGWNINETLQYTDELIKRGCNYLHVSTGGLSSHQKIPIQPGYQVPYAEIIKKTHSNIPIIAVGLITDPHQAETILQANQSDFIALARGVLYKPRWGWEAAIKLHGTVDASEQYWRCLPNGVPRETFRYPMK